MAQAGADAEALAKPLANLVINDLAARMNADEAFDLAECALTPARAIELVGLQASDAISSKQAKEVLEAVLEEDPDVLILQHRIREQLYASIFLAGVLVLVVLMRVLCKLLIKKR